MAFRSAYDRFRVEYTPDGRRFVDEEDEVAAM